MTSNLVALIDSKIQIEWSPDQISGWLREDHNLFISHETIYLYIWADKKRGGQLFLHLRRKGKAYQSRSKDKQAGRGFIRNRVSIDERPSVVEDKNRIGDWEIDLVIGKGHSGRASAL
jgi:IS30 family transposase